MKRRAHYVDDNPNRYATSQMQQMSAHRMQQHTRMNNFPGRPDSLSAEQVQPHTSSRGEDPRQWDTSVPNELNPVSSHLYSQGQGGNVAQSFPDGRVAANQKVDGEKQVHNDPRLQSFEQDMEIGYDDKPSPPSFEGLEQKFQDEILKLVKEQSDAEDVENARHREKLVEINNQYQERLVSLRAQQAKRREELLRKESQERLHQYQQSGTGTYPSERVSSDPRLYQHAGMPNHQIERIPSDPRGNQQAGMGNHATERIPSDPRGYQKAGMGKHPTERVPSDPRGYHQAGMGNHPTERIPSDPRVYQHAGIGNHPNERVPTDPRSYGAAGATHRSYGSGQNDSYREQIEFHGGRRSDRNEVRVPYPQGRVYNNASDRDH